MDKGSCLWCTREHRYLWSTDGRDVLGHRARMCSALVDTANAGVGFERWDIRGQL